MKDQNRRKGKGKAVILNEYSKEWLLDWIKEELFKCAVIHGILCCKECFDYGTCAHDPLRVILKRLAEKEPVVPKVEETRFFPVN